MMDYTERNAKSAELFSQLTNDFNLVFEVVSTNGKSAGFYYFKGIDAETVSYVYRKDENSNWFVATADDYEFGKYFRGMSMFDPPTWSDQDLESARTITVDESAAKDHFG